MAGSALLERVLSLSNSKYGCYKDGDFPKVFFLNFPFSEMLTPEMDAKKLRNELNGCLNQLRDNGATVLAIACNTLHAFLDGDQKDLVHLPKSLVSVIPKAGKPVVLCTSTSVRFGLHKQYFSCDYPDVETQLVVDDIIDRILMGADRQRILQDLKQVVQYQTQKTIILGCTELSLYTNRLSIRNKIIIDPLDVVANELLKISFSKEKIC